MVCADPTGPQVMREGRVFLLALHAHSRLCARAHARGGCAADYERRDYERRDYERRDEPRRDEPRRDEPRREEPRRETAVDSFRPSGGQAERRAYEERRYEPPQEAPDAKRPRVEERPAPAEAKPESASEKLAKLRAKQAQAGGLFGGRIGSDYAGSSSANPALGIARYQQLMKDNRR